MSLGLNAGRLNLGNKTLAEAAVAVIRSYGTNAHVYMPGAGGVAVSGLSTGNYTDQTLTTYASVDGTVGGVVDATGGINASQSTAGNRPTVRRGLYNLLTYSNDLSNAAWSATGVTKGTNVITEDTATSMHGLARFTTWPAATPATAAFVVSAGTAAKCWIGNASAATAACFDLTTGTVEGNIGSIVGSITPLGGGQYLIAAQHTATVAQTLALAMYSTFVSGNYASTISYAGTSRTLNVVSGGLFQGTLTASQILADGGIPLTTSAAASNQSAGRYSWQFDGVNDSLALGSVPFQATDDFAIIAACNPTTDTVTNRRIFGAGGATALIELYIGSTSGAPVLRVKDDAAVDTFTSKNTSAFGSFGVITGHKVGDVKNCRLNGSPGTAGSTATTTSTLTAVSIGSTSTGSANTNGSIGPVILIKGAVSDADLLILERWVASQTPNGPTF